MSSLHLKHQPADVYSSDGGKDKGEWAANTWELQILPAYAWYQASAMKWMISALFWDITQHIVVIPYWQIVHW